MDDYFDDEEDIIYDNSRLLKQSNRRSMHYGKRALILFSLFIVFICLGLSYGVLGPTLPCLEALTTSREDQASLVFAGRAIGSLGGWLLSRILLAGLPIALPPGALVFAGLTLLGVANMALPWPGHIWWLMPAFALQGGALVAVETGGLALLQLTTQGRSLRCHHILLCVMTLGCALAPLLASPFIDNADCKPGQLSLDNLHQLSNSTNSQSGGTGQLPSLSRNRRQVEEEIWNENDTVSSPLPLFVTEQPITEPLSPPPTPKKTLSKKPGLTDGNLMNQHPKSADGSNTAKKIQEQNKQNRLSPLQPSKVKVTVAPEMETTPTTPIVTTEVMMHNDSKNVSDVGVAVEINSSNTSTTPGDLGHELVTVTVTPNAEEDVKRGEIGKRNSSSVEEEKGRSSTPSMSTTLLTVRTITTTATTVMTTTPTTPEPITEVATSLSSTSTTTGPPTTRSTTSAPPSSASTTTLATTESLTTTKEAVHPKPIDTTSTSELLKHTWNATQLLVSNMRSVQKIYVLLGGLSLLVALLTLPCLLGRCFTCCCCLCCPPAVAPGVRFPGDGNGGRDTMDYEEMVQASRLAASFAGGQAEGDVRYNSVHSWAANVTVGQAVGLVLLALVHLFYAGMEVTFGGFLYSYAVRYLQWTTINGVLLTVLFWSCMTLGRTIPALSSCWGPRALWLHLSLALVAASLLTLSPTTASTSSNQLPWFWLSTALLGLTLSGVSPALLAWTEAAYRPSHPPLMTPQVATRIGEMFLPVLTGYLHRVTTSSGVLIYLTLACVLAVVASMFGLKILSRSGRLAGTGSRTVRRPPPDFVEGISDDEAGNIPRSTSIQLTKVTGSDKEVNGSRSNGVPPLVTSQPPANQLGLSRKKRTATYTRRPAGDHSSRGGGKDTTALLNSDSEEDELGLK